VPRDELRAATPALTQRLRDVIAAATLTLACVTPPLPLHRPSGARAYVALVSALPASLRGAPGRPAVILFLSSRTSPVANPHHLAELYGLTPAEARRPSPSLRRGPQRPSGPPRGLGQHIKTQLRHVFEKTGTGRQAELVALLLATSLPAEPAS